MANIVNG